MISLPRQAIILSLGLFAVIRIRIAIGRRVLTIIGGVISVHRPLVGIGLGLVAVRGISVAI